MLFGLESTSLVRGESLGIAVTGLIGQGHAELLCSIAHVGEFEDEWIASIGAVEKADGPGHFSFALPNTLQPGLYYVSSLSLRSLNITRVHEDDLRHTTAPDTDHLLFEVRRENERPRELSALRQERERLLQTRHTAFVAGLGSAAATKRYRAFVFVRDCLLTIPTRLDRCEILPAGQIARDSEERVVLDFLAAIDPDIRKIDWSVGRDTAPSACVHFPVIRANNPEQAIPLAIQEATLVCDALGVYRGSYAAVLAAVVVDEESGILSYSWNTVPYRGNQLGGFISGEQPRVLRRALQRVRSDARRPMYLAMLREALRADGWESAVFRFWSLLEAIARGKGLKGRPVRTWDGSIVVDQHGTPRKIGDGAKELVFETLREALRSEPPTDYYGLARGPRQPSYAEMVTIWYQRRNCVAHVGTCQYWVAAVCRVDKASCVSCNLARLETLESQAAGVPMDIYVETLKNATIAVVASECFGSPAAPTT